MCNDTPLISLIAHKLGDIFSHEFSQICTDYFLDTYHNKTKNLKNIALLVNICFSDFEKVGVFARRWHNLT